MFREINEIREVRETNKERKMNKEIEKMIEEAKRIGDDAWESCMKRDPTYRITQEAQAAADAAWAAMFS